MIEQHAAPISDTVTTVPMETYNALLDAYEYLAEENRETRQSLKIARRDARRNYRAMVMGSVIAAAMLIAAVWGWVR